MKKAVIYARVSTKEQEAEGFSVPSQLKTTRKYASKLKLQVEREFTESKSARHPGRTQFNAMLDFLEKYKDVKNILVEKTDRLSRNMHDLADMYDLIQLSDVSLHLVLEGRVLNKNSHSNDFVAFGINGVMSKGVSDNIVSEVKKGMLEKAEQGVYPSHVPYGYKNVRENMKKGIRQDPEAALYVKKMFELYATGNHSLKSIHKTMLEDGMVYRNGKNFHKSTVEYILTNVFYMGSFVWAGKTYENASHEPIITKELFWKVQSMLKRPNKNKSQKSLFTYPGMIKCGVCGLAITAQLQKKYIYYHCTGNHGNCKQRYIREEAIDEAFEALFENVCISQEIQKIIIDGLKKSYKEKTEYSGNSIKQIDRQLVLLRTRIDNAYYDKLDGKISEDRWLEIDGKLQADKDRLERKRFSFQEVDTNFLEKADLLLELARNASRLFKGASIEKKRKIINLMCSNCSCSDGNIDIELRLPFNLILKTSKTGKWCTKLVDVRTFIPCGFPFEDVRAVLSYGYMRA